MKSIVAYTDGGCRGNGKPDAVGGYGIVLMFTDENGLTHRKEIKKGFKAVTNNMMELQAVIDCLKALNEPCNVTIMTDSKYVCNSISLGWLKGWAAKGWVNSSKQPVKNREQWEELLPLLDKHEVGLFWVKGHAENEYNNRCDELANEAMDEMKTDEVKEKAPDFFEVVFALGKSNTPSSLREFKHGTKREIIEADYEEWKKDAIEDLVHHGGWYIEGKEFQGQVID